MALLERELAELPLTTQTALLALNRTSLYYVPRPVAAAEVAIKHANDVLPTLESLAASLTEKDGIVAELSVIGERRRLPPEVDLVLFRIAQEALNNVKKNMLRPPRR